MWLNQVCLAAGWQAYFHRSPWRKRESEQTNEWGNAQPRTHTHTNRHWHLIEGRSAAKALCSPQLAPSSDTASKASGAEPSPHFCFKEALMSFFFFSSADIWLSNPQLCPFVDTNQQYTEYPEPSMTSHFQFERRCNEFDMTQLCSEQAQSGYVNP